MGDELGDTSEVYTANSSPSLPFTVQLHTNVSRDRLREILNDDCTLFHYIGHVTEAGFACSDGYLDVATVDEVGVECFLLNACESYRQGVKMVNRGAVGGVVTFTDVLDAEAVRVGQLLTRLLNAGFDLRSSLAITQSHTTATDQYLVVGDGRLTLKRETAVPRVVTVNRTDSGDVSSTGGHKSPESPESPESLRAHKSQSPSPSDDGPTGPGGPDEETEAKANSRSNATYRVRVHTYPNRTIGLGSAHQPAVLKGEYSELVPGTTRLGVVSEPTLTEILTDSDTKDVPVAFEGSLYWPTTNTQTTSLPPFLLD
jgi:hypothetical protein